MVDVCQTHLPRKTDSEPRTRTESATLGVLHQCCIWRFVIQGVKLIMEYYSDIIKILESSIFSRILIKACVRRGT